MDRFRCPICLTIMWSARAMCAGGTPVYDPQAPPGSRHPEHDPVLGVPAGEDPTPYRNREPFEVRHLPYVAIVQKDGTRLAFGPFPAMEAVDRFLADYRLFGYSVHAMFPATDADRFRR
jgi:hypothetical protein